jgi:hypothetical protein
MRSEDMMNVECVSAVDLANLSKLDMDVKATNVGAHIKRSAAAKQAALVAAEAVRSVRTVMRDLDIAMSCMEELQREQEGRAAAELETQFLAQQASVAQAAVAQAASVAQDAARAAQVAARAAKASSIACEEYLHDWFEHQKLYPSVETDAKDPHDRRLRITVTGANNVAVLYDPPCVSAKLFWTQPNMIMVPLGQTLAAPSGQDPRWKGDPFFVDLPPNFEQSKCILQLVDNDAADHPEVSLGEVEIDAKRIREVLSFTTPVTKQYPICLNGVNSGVVLVELYCETARRPDANHSLPQKVHILVEQAKMLKPCDSKLYRYGCTFSKPEEANCKDSRKAQGEGRHPVFKM